MEKQSKNSQKINAISLDVVINLINNFNTIPPFDKEPMYDLNNHNVAVLKGLVDIPFTSFYGKDKYETLEEKAAALFCLTIRGHKFGNGNKRTAVILLFVFLKENNKWIKISWRKLYSISMKVASQVDMDYDKQIQELAEFFGKHIIDID